MTQCEISAVEDITLHRELSVLPPPRQLLTLGLGRDNPMARFNLAGLGWGMRASRSFWLLGVALLALGMFVTAGAATPASTDGPDPNPVAPGYYASAPGETVSTRMPSRVGEFVARTVIASRVAAYAERLLCLCSDRVTRPLPRPRGDRGPPSVLS